MLFTDVFLFYWTNNIIVTFYFFWLSWWSEILFCHFLFFYNSYLFFKKKNFFKSLFYTFIVVCVGGLYISLINFDIFMCFLWVFEFSLFFYLFVLTIMFQHNSNYYFTKTLQFRDNQAIWLFFLVYWLYFWNFSNLHDEALLIYYYWVDIYDFLQFFGNDLYVIFLIYYYYYSITIYLILLTILILTFILISFFKLLKNYNHSTYLKFWVFFNKLLKRQTYENQKIKKSIVKLFVKCYLKIPLVLLVIKLNYFLLKLSIYIT